MFPHFGLPTGLPALVLQRILEILAYLAKKQSTAANMLFFFDQSIISQALRATAMDNKKDKGKERIECGNTKDGDIPLILFFKLLNRPLFLHGTSHLEQVEWNFCSMSFVYLFFFWVHFVCSSSSILDAHTFNIVLQLKLPLTFLSKVFCDEHKIYNVPTLDWIA